MELGIFSWSLAFKAAGQIDDVVVTTAAAPAGGPYLDLTVGGTIDGSAIVGFAIADGADNVEGTGAGFLDGLDRKGLAVETADDRLFNIYKSHGRIYLDAVPVKQATFSTTAPCYLAGTRIAVPGGERAVEEIAAGDLVQTAAGVARPVRWVGWRAFAGRFARANPGMQPVRVRAGALGAGLPRRDLLVSPDHALLLDGILIPAAGLVNGHSITRERGLTDIRYHHIELETHDILLAEGAAAESYLDDDSRLMFHNGFEGVPCADPGSFCAPRLTDGEAVEAVRRRLADVAAPREMAA